MKRVLMIAGESSGDLHGSLLMRQLKLIEPDIEFRGIGGTLMIREGLAAFRHVRDMNFMGIAEVIRHLPFIRRTLYELAAYVEYWNPDLAILIDYAGFNLKLAPLLQKRGIPIMYYISPKLWAWNERRVKKIKKYIDRMVVIFDFEVDFYHRHGITADFVGNPLLDFVHPAMDNESFKTLIGAETSKPVIGLLPGSRVQEINRMLPIMVESLGLIEKMVGKIVPVLGCAPEIGDEYYRSFISDTDIIPLREKTYDIMAHSDALIIASGTATLEAGILETPMVIVYKTSFLTYFIGKLLVKIPDIGLINIVAGNRIIPELLQQKVTPDTIAGEIVKYLKNDDYRNAAQKSLKSATMKLGKPGAARNAAQIAYEMMNHDFSDHSKISEKITI